VSAKALGLHPLPQGLEVLPAVHRHDGDALGLDHLCQGLQIGQHFGQVVAANLLGEGGV
jgi:hypothetical protein